MTVPKFKAPAKVKPAPRGSENPNLLLTEELSERFCKLILDGLPLQYACDYLGISYGAVHKWRARGERALGGGAEEEEIYATFILELRKAHAQYLYRRVKKLHRSKQWVRELAILERRDRSNFSRNEQDGGSFEEYDADERFA